MKQIIKTTIKNLVDNLEIQTDELYQIETDIERLEDTAELKFSKEEKEYAEELLEVEYEEIYENLSPAQREMYNN